MSPAPTISVVVLSYNRPAHLRDALAAVVGQGYPALEIIVVDNRSEASERVAEVVRAFPGVRFLPQPANLGFAAGMNVGLRAATGEFVHLTEDDIVLESGFYSRLLPHAAARPRDLFSGLVYENPGESCLFAGTTLEIGSRYVQEAIPSPSGGAEPYPVGMLIGAMMFGTREAFAAAGEFREEFFVYFEDAELCWRARRAGVGLWVVPTVRARHTAPARGAFHPTIEFHKLKNYLTVNLLYMPPLPAVRMAAKFFAYTTVRKAIQGRSVRFLARIWLWSAVHLWPILLERWSRRRTSGGGR